MRSILSVAVLAAAKMTSAAAAAADEPVSAIRAGRLVDVDAGKVLTDQVIVVRGGRIESVGPPGSVSIPAGSKIFLALAWLLRFRPHLQVK